MPTIKREPSGTGFYRYRNSINGQFARKTSWKRGIATRKAKTEKAQAIRELDAAIAEARPDLSKKVIAQDIESEFEDIGELDFTVEY